MNKKILSCDVDLAIDYLLEGKVICLPTETVFGLACAANEPKAINKIYSIKARSAAKPLVIYVASAAQAKKIAYFTPLAQRLYDQFMPGPLTIVLKRRKSSLIDDSININDDTIGIRCSKHEFITKLLKKFARPIIVTSANYSGMDNLTNAKDVEREIGLRVDAIFDDGSTTQDISATVIDASGSEPVLLRQGVIPFDDIITKSKKEK